MVNLLKIRGRLLWNDKDKLLIKAYPYIITTVFLALSIALIYHHEFWRDEMISWHYSSESSSFHEFIENMRGNVGHPYLWYSILYLISHFITENPESMKIVHLTISTISVFLILKYAPFNKIIKVMLVFGYFFFYEYSIISRNYALGVLCIVLFCILYKNKYKNILPIAIVLFFMGQANLYSFIISIALFLSLVIEFIIDRKYVAENIKKIYIILAVLIVIGEILFIYWQLGSQESPYSSGTSILSIFDRSIEDYFINTMRISKGIVGAYIPIPQFTLSFWESNIIVYFLSGFKFLYTFIIILILIIIPMFVIKRRYIFLYIVGTFGILFIPFFVYLLKYIRHFGHLFLLFITCLWLSNINKDDKYLINTKGNFNKIFRITFLIIILIASLIGSSVAFYYDWKYPFSNAKYVAEYIEENFDKDKIVIVGYQDYVAETVAGYLDKDIYYPNYKEFRKLVTWPDRIDQIPTDETFRDAYNLSIYNDEVLVITWFDASEEKIPEYYFFKKLDTNFTNSIVSTENYYLFLYNKDTFIKKYLSDMLYEIDKSNFEKYFRPMNQCEFIKEKDSIKIKVYGDDPWFETAFPFEFKDSNPILVFFNIDYSVEGEFRIFFKRPGKDCTIEDSLSFSIDKGENIIYMKIPYSENLKGLRIDPVNTDSDCIIREVKFYNLRD